MLESDFLDFKGELFKEFSQNLLVVSDGRDVRFVEVDPDFNTVAGRVVDFAGDESKAVNFFTELEVLANEEEG